MPIHKLNHEIIQKTVPRAAYASHQTGVWPSPGGAGLSRALFVGAIVIAAMTLILLQVQILYAENTILNPSFEDGTQSWTLGDANSSIDGTVARTGSKSLKLINDASLTDHNAGQYSIENIQAGKEYAFSVWVKGVNVTGNGEGGKPLVVLRWRNNTNVRILSEMYLWADYGTYDWRELKMNLLAPANATKVDVSFRSWFDCTGGTTYWDDASLDLRDVSYRGNSTGSYQTENSSLNSGGSILSTESNYTGTGYFHVEENAAFVEWDNVDGGAGGTRILSFRYSLEANAKSWNVKVNGVSKGNKTPIATGKPNSWATIDWEVPLSAGNNYVRVTVSQVSEGPQIDKLDVYEKSEGFVDTAATPTITPNGGTHTDSVEVALASTTAGATIYYTTNGSTPTVGSTQYTGPFTLTSSVTIKAVATANGYNNSAIGSAQFTVNVSEQLPYGGDPLAIPGTIEAEDYDVGGEGISYHDTTNGNMGGVYREDNVDIWYSDVEPEGYYVGAINNGEWLEYTVDVAQAGQYYFDIVMATPNNSRTMHIEMDGSDITGQISLPNTGSYAAWQTHRVTAGLSQGRHVLRVVLDTQGINFHKIQISATGETATVDSPLITPDGGTFDGSVEVTLSTTTPGSKIYYTIDGSTPTIESNEYVSPLTVTTNNTTVKALATAGGYLDSDLSGAFFTINSVGQQPFGGQAWSVPGTIQAEDYDLGGQGVAYNDGTAGNAGSHYRTDRVDIWYSPVSPQGYYVGYTETNEWLEYTINVTEAGQFTFNLQVATPNNGRSMHLEIDGVNVTGAIALPNTGGWDVWQEVEVSSLGSITQGQHVLRAVFDVAGLNFHKIEVSKNAAAPTFSPNGGTHFDSVTVELATTTAGATIYYTTDGSTPTSGSSVYNAPFVLTADATVKAFAVANGYNNSTVASAVFEITDTPPPVVGNPSIVPALEVLLE